MSKLKSILKRLIVPNKKDLIIYFLIISYLLLLSNPSILFKNQSKLGIFNIYTDEENLPKSQLISLLKKSENLIKSSAFYNKEFNPTVVFVGSELKFRLLALSFGSSTGKYIPILNIIFLTKFDIKTDALHLSRKENNKRSLSGAIAHESTHALLENRLGVYQYFFNLKKWKDEGYADYIAQEGSFSHNKGMELICANSSDDSRSFEYFKYKKVVEFLLTKKKVVEEILFSTKYRFDKILLELKKDSCQ
jgi:hypothetical protein